MSFHENDGVTSNKLERVITNYLLGRAFPSLSISFYSLLFHASKSSDPLVAFKICSETNSDNYRVSFLG